MKKKTIDSVNIQCSSAERQYLYLLYIDCCTFLVKVMPKYFIYFIAIIKEIFSHHNSKLVRHYSQWTLRITSMLQSSLIYSVCWKIFIRTFYLIDINEFGWCLREHWRPWRGLEQTNFIIMKGTRRSHWSIHFILKCKRA